MVTYHPHWGDHVPGPAAEFGVPVPFPLNLTPESASTTTVLRTAAPPAGALACGKKPSRPSAM